MHNKGIILTDSPNTRIKRFLLKNRVVLRNSPYLVFSKENKVNLNAWITVDSTHNNVGDYLSLIVVDEVCKLFGIDIDKTVRTTKHLYAIGSILLGYQDATIWGSGFGYDVTKKSFFRLNALLHRFYHDTDIRLVRGPETRRILKKKGIDCPELYGDPAVLMPLFYNNKEVGHTRKYCVIPHYSKLEKYKGIENVVGTFTKDYKRFIDEILKSEMVISSSLHGIILAEAYGIPAIMLNDTPADDITKYKDWYYSTGRYKFPIAESIDEALGMTPVTIDKLIISQMQERLLTSFPRDLWEE